MYSLNGKGKCPLLRIDSCAENDHVCLVRPPLTFFFAHVGEDAGVVYSEMQGRENLPFSVMGLRQQRALYPEGSGYRSETGGLMDALRVLTVEQIRKYHGSYYLPHNICLFATGKIDPRKLLAVLQDEVEPSIEKHNQALGANPQGWKRPFMDTPSSVPPKLSEDRVETVEFPEADESESRGANCSGKRRGMS